MSKLERLLKLLAVLIDTTRPITADDLRQRIGGYPDNTASFRRAFERDKDDLRSMGITIAVERVADTGNMDRVADAGAMVDAYTCLLYTSPSPRDQRGSRMPSSA